MTILITGASGFIGSAILRAWPSHTTHELHAISRTRPNSSALTWHECDLFDERAVEHLFDKVKPTQVIHAAWETTHSRFWTCESNRNWLSASLRLLDAFERHGGKRFVFLGSMAEYDWTVSPLTENHSSEIPFTLYGETKLGFHRMLMHHAAAKKFSAATGRIFNLYGPNEKPERLIPQILGALAHSTRIKVGSADRERDLLHVDDVADALISLMRSDLEGPVNIANGKPYTMGDIYDVIGKVTQRGHLIGIGERADTPGEPKKLYADASLIRSTGWQPKIRLEDGLSDLWAQPHTQRAA